MTGVETIIHELRLSVSSLASAQAAGLGAIVAREHGESTRLLSALGVMLAIEPARQASAQFVPAKTGAKCAKCGEKWNPQPTSGFGPSRSICGACGHESQAA
jgi:hypothetical protein